MSPPKGQGRSRLVTRLLLASALCTALPPALAADPPRQIAQYAHTSWTARDGASLGLVFAMAQTPDGYLWIAGSLGLFRFDGHRFTEWQPPDGQVLPSGPYSLLASRDGTLWIGTFHGLSSWDGRKFVARHPEIGQTFVTSLVEDREGTVWAGLLGEAGRLCAIRGKSIQCAAPEGGFGSFVWSLAEDRAGQLWVGAEAGIWRWGPETPRRYPVPGARVGDLTTTADGQVLAGIASKGLWERAGDQWVPHRFRKVSKPDEWMADTEIKANKLLRDRDGGLWIGTEGLGLLHVKDGQADSFTRMDGLSGNIACSLFEDREGNVWYGSERGMDRFRKLPVTTLSTRQGLPDDVTKSVLAATDGALWVATNGGLARWKDGRLSIFKEQDGLPSAQVQAQYQDAQGRLWVSTATGLAYFANERFVAVDGGPSSEIFAMAGDAAGNLWLSGNKGLARLHQGRFAENIPWAALGHSQQAQLVVADRGGLWLSFWDGSGVSYVKNGKVAANYSFAHVPGRGQVTGLRVDDEGALWVATGSTGLKRIKDGRVTALTPASGLPCETIHWSTLDQGGALWMYTSCGLVRVDRGDLAAWIADPAHRVSPVSWGVTDGVPLMVTPQAYFNPPVARQPDGKLWFIAGAELLWADPANMPSNTVPPPVHIERLTADHQSYPIEQGLRLPPRIRDMTIDFVALSLADPLRTRFRYRLEGHDSDWREAVDRRQASYTNLPPGHYRFQVKAANNSGVWNEDGAQLEFTILPAFHQTTWFRVGSLVVLAGLIWAGFQLALRLRVRRLHRQFEATLEGRVAERTRIARDLHDTLLQRFNGLLLQFQAASNLLPDRPRESKRVLDTAIDQVAGAITEGRDTVQGLRASTLETNSLAEAVRTLARELSSESGRALPVDVQVQGKPQELHPLLRDETVRIAGEALRNAFRHAQATRIDVELRYDARQLCLQVRDDGQGIDPEVLRRGEREGHFGLSGMRERAEVVGGRLSVRCPEGGGTVVEFTAPLHRPPALTRP